MSINCVVGQGVLDLAENLPETFIAFTFCS